MKYFHMIAPQDNKASGSAQGQHFPHDGHIAAEFLAKNYPQILMQKLVVELKRPLSHAMQLRHLNTDGREEGNNASPITTGTTSGRTTPLSHSAPSFK